MKTVSLSFLFLMYASISFAEEAHPGVLGAKNFFELVATGKSDEAFEMTSSQFRGLNTREDFEGYLAEMKLDQLRSFNTVTATASQDDSEVSILANSNTASGDTLVTRIKTVLEDGVYRTEYFQAYPDEERTPPQVDDTSLSLAETKASLVKAANAIESENSAPYLDTTGMLHRQTIGKEMILGISSLLHQSPYGPLSDIAENLDPAVNAGLDGDVANYFHTVDFPERQRRIVMEFAALWDDPNPAPWLNRWRVVFLSTAEDLKPPGEEEATNMVKKTLVDFFNGAKSGDMEPFYDTGASYLREVATVDDFQNGFPFFTSGEIDLSEWKPEEAVPLSFSLSGNISKALVLEAAIPASGAPTFATLTYLYENGEWAVSGVSFSDTHPDEREEAQE